MEVHAQPNGFVLKKEGRVIPSVLSDRGRNGLKA
jgi:hypothetical protein